MASASIIIDILARTGSFETDTKRAEKSLKNLDKQLKETKLATDVSGASFRNVGNELKKLGAISLGGFGLSAIVNISDSYTKFTSQLKLATNSSVDFQRAYRSVINIATESQSDITSVGILYSRLSRSMKDVGITSKELNDITKTVALSLRVSGATAVETASTMLQLSQSFGAGRLNGQEFAAVAEASPILLIQLAKSMEKPIGALKQLAEEGRLTREELKKAFTDKEFLAYLESSAKEVGTLSSAFTVLKNNLTIYIGEADKANGASALIRSGIIGLADSFDKIANVALVLLGSSLSKYIISIQASISASKLKSAQLIKEQVIQERLNIATIEATRLEFALGKAKISNAIIYNKSLGALNENVIVMNEVAKRTGVLTVALGGLRTAFNFLGGPIGIAITGLLLFGGKLLEAGEKALGITPAIKGLNDEIERGNKLRALGISASDPNSVELEGLKQLENQLKEVKKARDSLQKVVDTGENKPATFQEFGARFKILGTGGASNAKDAVESADRQIKKLQDEIDAAKLKINVKMNPIVDVSGFEKLESQIKTVTAITREYNFAVEDATKQAKEQGIGQERLTEVLAKLKSQYDKDIDATTKVKKAKKEVVDESQKFVNSLVKEADTFNLSKSQIVEYNASLLTLTDNQKNVTQSIIDQIRAREDLNAFDEQDKLSSISDTFGLDEIESQSEATASAIETFRDKSYDAWVSLQPEAEQLAIAIEKIRSEAEKLGLGEDYSQPIVDSLQKTFDESQKSKSGFADLERAIDGFAKNSATAMADFIFGTKGNFSDMVNSMLKDIARLALQKSIFDPIAKGISGSISGSGGIGGWMKSLIPSFGGARANGGTVSGSSAYLVGERGPEIFKPNTSGTIIPNSSINSGGNVSVSVNVDAAGGDVQSNSDFGKQLGNAIKSVVQSELLKQKRQGGILA